MTSQRLSPGDLLGVVGLAAALRLVFVWWAPDETYGDPIYYAFYAHQIAKGNGFTEFDGSPAIFWMPGWPLLLSAVFAVFGPLTRAGMVLNALLGAATAGMVGALGARLLGRAAGFAAGLLYAVWPGTIYLASVLLAETAFNFFLVLALLLQVIALQQQPRARGAVLFAAGLGFGAAALTKAEPLILVPFLLAHLVLVLGPRQGLRLGACWLLALALALGPWVVRNRLHFADRWIVTSATGGTNFWIGNHLGSTGINDLPAETRFRERHQRASTALTNLAQNEAGWRDGLGYVRAHPGQALAAVPYKLWVSYSSDAAGTRNMKPLSDAARLALERVGNVFWVAMLAAAAGGLWLARRWSWATRVIVLGPIAAWFTVHAVFIGGPRFHAPEIPSLALLAGAALGALRARRAEAKSGD